MDKILKPVDSGYFNKKKLQIIGTQRGAANPHYLIRSPVPKTCSSDHWNKINDVD